MRYINSYTGADHKNNPLLLYVILITLSLFFSFGVQASQNIDNESESNHKIITSQIPKVFVDIPIEVINTSLMPKLTIKDITQLILCNKSTYAWLIGFKTLKNVPPDNISYGLENVVKRFTLPHSKSRYIKCMSIKDFKNLSSYQWYHHILALSDCDSFFFNYLENTNIHTIHLTKRNFHKPQIPDLIEDLQRSDIQTIGIRYESSVKGHKSGIQSFMSQLNKLKIHTFELEDTTIDQEIVNIALRVISKFNYSTLTALKIVKLSNKKLIPMLSQLTNLTSLSLHNNSTGIDSFKAVTSLTKLTSLSLDKNNIEDNDIIGITNLINLSILNLQNNKIGSEGINIIASLPKLSSLNLSHNNIGDLEVESLTHLTKLSSLNLSHNNISLNTIKSLTSLTNLSLLDLRGNKSGDGNKAITILTMLASLSRHNNDIDNRGREQVDILTGLISLKEELNEKLKTTDIKI